MRVNVQQYEVLKLLEKLGVICIVYADDVFGVDGTVLIDIETGRKW